MTDKSKEKETSELNKKIQPLTGKQKFMFGLICWGVQSWGQAKSFKTQGYDQKNKEAITA